MQGRSDPFSRLREFAAIVLVVAPTAVAAQSSEKADAALRLIYIANEPEGLQSLPRS